MEPLRPSGPKPGGRSGANSDIRYAGGFLVPNSGGRYHFGRRYYDPAVGRWTQIDPMNQPADLREGNRYVYVGGNPANAVDPSGMFSVSDVVDYIDDNAKEIGNAVGCALAFKYKVDDACEFGIEYNQTFPQRTTCFHSEIKYDKYGNDYVADVCKPDLEM